MTILIAATVSVAQSEPVINGPGATKSGATRAATNPAKTPVKTIKPHQAIAINEMRVVQAQAVLEPVLTPHASKIVQPATITKKAGYGLYISNYSMAYNIAAQVVRHCNTNRQGAEKTFTLARAALLQTIVRDYLKNISLRYELEQQPINFTPAEIEKSIGVLDTILQSLLSRRLASAADAAAVLKILDSAGQAELQMLLTDIGDYCESRQNHLDQQQAAMQARDFRFDSLLFSKKNWPENVVVIATQLQAEPAVGTASLLTLLDAASKTDFPAAVRALESTALQYTLLFVIGTERVNVVFPEIPFVLHSDKFAAKTELDSIVLICGKESQNAGATAGIQGQMADMVFQKLKTTFPKVNLTTNHGHAQYTQAEILRLLNDAIADAIAQEKQGIKPTVLVCIAGHGSAGRLAKDARPGDVYLQGSLDSIFQINPDDRSTWMRKAELRAKISELAKHCKTVILHYGPCGSGSILG